MENQVHKSIEELRNLSFEELLEFAEKLQKKNDTLLQQENEAKQQLSIATSELLEQSKMEDKLYGNIHKLENDLSAEKENVTFYKTQFEKYNKKANQLETELYNLHRSHGEQLRNLAGEKQKLEMQIEMEKRNNEALAKCRP